MSDDSGGLIRGSELNRLVDLFRQFEGASDPLSIPCREAEQQFNLLIDNIYAECVIKNYASITLSQFRSYTRNHCRKILAKQGPPYPCA